jgi:hypothetical protein
MNDESLRRIQDRRLSGGHTFRIAVYGVPMPRKTRNEKDENDKDTGRDQENFLELFG